MSDAQKWLVLVAVVLAGWLVYLLADVLTPFFVATLLAYLGDPLTVRLEKMKLSRTVAVVIVFIMMLASFFIGLLILIPLMQNQLLSFVRRISDLIGWIETGLFPILSLRLGINLDSISLDSIRETLMENWRDVGNVAGYVFSKVSDSGQAILAWLVYILLIPVVTFYLLRDWDVIVSNIRSAIPKRHEKTIVSLVTDCDDILSEFLRGQLLVMLALAMIYSIGLWIVGLEFALLIGMVAGLVSFVPYLGAIVGIGAALVIAFLQFHDVLHLLYVLLVFGIGQSIESMVLSPSLVGERIGLHPVAVIFAVLAGGQLFGFPGILLALPVAAVCVVLLRFGYEKYKNSALHSSS